MAQDISVSSIADDVLKSADMEKVQAANLCQYWPDAKAFLQLLLTVINNAVVKLVIPIIIAIGDKLCPGVQASKR